MNFYTSDTHLSHANIIRYSNRPFASVEEMNEAIFAEIASLPDNCFLYHLGDVSFGSYGVAKENYDRLYDIISRKNIFTTIIRGNHDKHLDLWLSSQQDNKIVRLLDYLEIRDGNSKVVLFHYPVQSWNSKHHGVHHFYGHTHRKIPDAPDYDHHTSDKKHGKRIHVGVDTAGYKPKTLTELLELYEQGVC